MFLFRHRLVQLVIAAALCATPHVAEACAACFGKSDSKMAQAYNMGIFAMLGFVALMFVGVISFFVYITRRAASVSNASAQLPATSQNT